MSQDVGGAEALLWPTPEDRQRAFGALCDHVAAGYSVASFPGADAGTLHYYTRQYPEDFPAWELQAAIRRGLLEWERIGKAGSQGELAKFNATAWVFNMKNRVAGDEGGGPAAWPPGGAPEEGHARGSGKTRSSEEIALGVMALLTAKEVLPDDKGSGDSD